MWAPHAALVVGIAVAVILIPVLAASTLARTGLACDPEVVSGSFFAVESFGVGINIVVLLFSQARAAIDWVLNKWPFTVQKALYLVSTFTDMPVEELIGRASRISF